MTFQKLCKKYKEEICPYCKNRNESDCKICKTIDGVKCNNYLKDKDKIKKTEPEDYYVKWQV